ncbi:hypothetical protein LTR94_024867, partial [Friedmanniomyces endolithicus]
GARRADARGVWEHADLALRHLLLLILGEIMKNSLKAALLVSSALIATPALAQQQPTPPEHYTVDANGVDLVQGTFNYSTTDVVIGKPGQGGIAFGRSYVNGGWRDNLAGTIAVSGATHVVSYGGYSEAFTQSGSNYVPNSNNGSTLTRSGNTFTFMGSDGTVATYSTLYSGSTSPYVANGAAIMSLTSPNGERLDYHWNGVSYCTMYGTGGGPGGVRPGIDDDEPLECITYANAVRLEAVRNNRGYQIKFLYASDAEPASGIEAQSQWLNRTGVMGVNLAVDSCPVVGPCTAASRTWPTMTYSAGLFGGNMTSTTDQSGNTTLYAYNSGVLSAVRLPGSSVDDIAINYASGKVSNVTTANGTWNYTYADSGTTRTTTASGPLGQNVTATSNLSIGRATSVAQALSSGVTATTSYLYDGQRRLQRVTQPEGDYAQLTYDARGNVTQTLFVPKPGSGLSNIATYASYPSSCTNPKTCNQPITTTDARGGVTNYIYDSGHGGVTTITAPAPTAGATRPETRISYAAQTAYFKPNPSSGITAATSSVVLPTATSACSVGTAAACVGTANESRTTIAYGTAGIANNLVPTLVTARDGTGSLSAPTAFTYTPDGDIASVNGPLDGVSDTLFFRYDSARRQVGTVSADPDGGGGLMRRAERITYNARGAVSLIEVGTVAGLSDGEWSAFNSLQQSTSSFDVYGRPTQQRLQSGGTTHSLVQISYDAAGRQDCLAMRMNSALFGSPEGAACALGPQGAFGPDRITKYGYDWAGRLISSIAGLGTSSAIEESANYSLNSKPISMTDGKGNVSNIAYDGFDRRHRVYYPNPSGGGTSASDFEEFGYDAAGNLTSLRNRAGEILNAGYDSLGRQTSLGGSAIADRTFSYDLLSRQTGSAFTGGGAGSTLYWDALGRQTSEHQNGVGGFNYGYDLAGRRTSM